MLLGRKTEQVMFSRIKELSNVAVVVRWPGLTVLVNVAVSVRSWLVFLSGGQTWLMKLRVELKNES